MAVSNQSYYETPSEWGKDNFITLQNVIDNIILTASDDSYFKKLEPFRALIHAKMGLKKLNIDLPTENKAIAIQLGASRTFPMPRYATSWTRVSVKNRCKKLKVLGESNKPLIKDYLQDHKANLLYDHNGNVLEGKPYDSKIGNCVSIQFSCEENNCKCNDKCCNETKKYKDSFVRFINSEQYFEFSADLEDEIIVIEYQTNGLGNKKACDIKINDNLEMVITNYIKWKSLEALRNTPIQDALYFKKEYLIEKKRAKNLLMPKISIDQIITSVSQARF